MMPINSGEPIPSTFEIGQRVCFKRLFADTIAERRYIGRSGIIVGMETWLLFVRFDDNEVHPFNWSCFECVRECERVISEDSKNYISVSIGKYTVTRPPTEKEMLEGSICISDLVEMLSYANKRNEEPTSLKSSSFKYQIRYKS